MAGIVKIFSLVFFLTSAMSTMGVERFAIPYMPEKDLTKTAQILKVKPLEVNVDMTRPAKVFQPIEVSLSFKQNGKRVQVENLKMKFNMKMDMGNFRAAGKLINGSYLVKTLLPKCMWGDKRWFGKIEFDYHGQSYSTVFFFEIKG